MPDNSVLPSTASALLRRTAKEQADGRAPGLVAGVVRDGALAWSAGRGRVGGAAPDAGTQFRIGSITKTFTAILVARLRDEGKLSFADPLDRHLPGTLLGDRTIAQLLSHTAGLQAEANGPWWERTPGEDWAGLSATFTEELTKHRPGRRFHYSNPGFATLGELVARLRGSSWQEALRAEVLSPLGMRRTTYSPEAPHADGFAVHPWADVVLPEPAHDSGAMAPAGQLWSTITDLGRLAALVGGDTGEVLNPDTVAEMREPATVEDGPAWTSAYGRGLQLLKTGGRTLAGHGGSMPGFLAGLLVDVEDGIGAVMLANTTTGVGPGPLCADLITTVSEQEPTVPAEWLPPGGLAEGVLDLVGPWYWGPTPYLLRATGADGWLNLRPVSDRGRGSRFRPVETDQWIGLDGYYAGETLRAVRKPDGSVRHLDLATFVFSRTPYDPEAAIPGGVDPAGWR